MGYEQLLTGIPPRGDEQGRPIVGRDHEDVFPILWRVNDSRKPGQHVAANLIRGGHGGPPDDSIRWPIEFRMGGRVLIGDPPEEFQPEYGIWNGADHIRLFKFRSRHQPSHR